jgi:hypothetical protein
MPLENSRKMQTTKTFIKYKNYHILILTIHEQIKYIANQTDKSRKVTLLPE